MVCFTSVFLGNCLVLPKMVALPVFHKHFMTLMSNSERRVSYIRRSLPLMKLHGDVDVKIYLYREA